MLTRGTGVSRCLKRPVVFPIGFVKRLLDMAAEALRRAVWMVVKRPKAAFGGEQKIEESSAQIPT